MSERRKVALVTGGAKRVGRAIALGLAGAGYDIAITYHSGKEEAGQLDGTIQEMGRRFIAIQCDLTEPEPSTAEIHRRIMGEFGGLDVLVNNASLFEPGNLQQLDLSIARRLWEIHVETPLLLCRHFEKPLRESNGHVINMLDLLAEKPMSSHLAYCASKAALWNLTLGLAKELAPEVTVNGIAPGVVEWPDGYPEAERAKYLRRVPLGRAGSPGDVAAAVLYFCRDGAYVTGQVLRVDGGRSIV